MQYGRALPARQSGRAVRDLTELNINEGGQPVTRPAPTDEQIEAFERHFGLELPVGHIALLRFSNGGHPELNLVEPVGRPGAAAWGVGRFHHLSDDREAYESLWKAIQVWRPFLGLYALPFADDQNGNEFFLDLQFNPPPVRACIHDEGFRTVDIAPSLEVFIDRLKLDPDAI